MPLSQNSLTKRASLYPLSFGKFPSQRNPTRGRQAVSNYSPRSYSHDISRGRSHGDNRVRSHSRDDYEGIILF